MTCSRREGAYFVEDGKREGVPFNPMAAHIGVGLASEPGGTLVITSMSPKGTAATSGMLRANDQLIKVDGVAVQSPQHAQQLLHGEANTIVKVKVRRRTQQGLVNLDVSLVREVGDEHNLTQKHQGFKSAYVPQNQTSAEEVWKKIEHGQARFNQSQVIDTAVRIHRTVTVRRTCDQRRMMPNLCCCQ